MESMFLSVGQKAISLALILCAPTLIAGLIVGLVVSVFQAATQIQESTLSFVPKIVAVVVVGLMFGPWVLKMMVGFTREMLTMIPTLVK